MVDEDFADPPTLAEAEETTLAKLEERTREILAYMRSHDNAAKAGFEEEAHPIDGGVFLARLVAKRVKEGIELVFTLRRNDKSAIYANPPGDYQGGYHYLLGEYARQFGGILRNVNWAAGSFAVLIEL